MFIIAWFVGLIAKSQQDGKHTVEKQDIFLLKDRRDVRFGGSSL